MTSLGLGEMFESDFAEMCAGIFLMGSRAEGLVCAETGAKFIYENV